MTHRTVICVLLVAVVGAALACSAITERDKQAVPAATDGTSATVPANTGSTSASALVAPVEYLGVTSIEERISASDVIVRARLTNMTTELVTTTGEHWAEYFFVALKFHLSVSEYLTGRGANGIVAYWVSLKQFSTRQDAQDAAAGIAAQRDTQWDNREAVLFLHKERARGWSFDPLAQAESTYILSFGSRRGVGPTFEDYYSLTSRINRLWLPSTSVTPATPIDSQEFLLETPVSGGAPSTITLRELKTRVAAVSTELNAGDGSEAYKGCVHWTYTENREDDWREREGGQSERFPPTSPDSFASGQAVGRELFKYFEGFEYEGKKSKFWLDGQDSVLFAVKEGPHRPNWDRNGDGQPNDGTVFDHSVALTRPLPQGSYTFNTNLIIWALLACGHTYTYEVTANVNAPSGVLHELFFDPVTVGSSVAADGSNGVLKPLYFTAAGAAASIGGIEWAASSTGSGQSGTVKVKVSSHTGLAGQIMDFIELDGAVSLSLNVADATVDSANDTLSWSVSSQPWEDGDKLMVRIREAR